MTTKMPERHIDANTDRGFTLVEIAIVLVIIGLIVGGILVGRDLIRAAELRSVLSDVEKYRSAVNTFRVMYNGTPGDMVNATDFWGTDPGGCPLTPANTVPHAPTCNGSGSGQVNNYNGSYASYPEESFRFWQQLANANLIPGSYTGVVTSGGANTEDVILGVNVPTAKISGTGWFVHFWGTADFNGTAISQQAANKNYFTLIGDPHDSAPCCFGGSPRSLGTQDTWNIDNKIDDGEPYSGQVVSLDLMLFSASCTTNCCAAPTEYIRNSNSIGCLPTFAAGF